MAIHRGRKLADGLVFQIDISDRRSYISGSDTITDIINNHVYNHEPETVYVPISKSLFMTHSLTSYDAQLLSNHTTPNLSFGDSWSYTIALKPNIVPDRSISFPIRHFYSNGIDNIGRHQHYMSYFYNLNSAVFDNNGNTYIAGQYGSYDNEPSSSFLVKIDSSGSVDDTFRFNHDWPSGVNTVSTLMFHNGILYGGGTNYTDCFITVNTSSGQLTTSAFGDFNAGIGNHMAHSPSDNTIVLAHQATEFKGQTCKYISKIDDTTFANVPGFDTTKGGLSNKTTYSVTVDSTGNIYVAFNGTQYNNSGSRYFAKIDGVTGDLDATYMSYTEGGQNNIYGLAVQSDDKLLVAQRTYFRSETNAYYCNRLLPSGELDPDWLPNTYSNTSNTYPKCVYYDDDGSVFFGGRMTSFAGISVGRIVKLDDSGSLDPLFASGSGFDNNVEHISRRPDGKLVVLGSFTTYKGSDAPGMAVLDYDTGLLDEASMTNVGDGFVPLHRDAYRVYDANNTLKNIRFGLLTNGGRRRLDDPVGIQGINGKWSSLTVTYNTGSSLISFYADGELLHSSAPGYNIPLNVSDFTMEGYLRRITVWDRELTPTEVNSNFSIVEPLIGK